MLTVCEASLICPKPCDLDLFSSDGAANGLPHQREWLHNSQFGALCLSLLFSPDRRKSAKNVPNVSALSPLCRVFAPVNFFSRNGQLILGQPSTVNTADSPAVFRCILFACNFRGFPYLLCINSRVVWWYCNSNIILFIAQFIPELKRVCCYNINISPDNMNYEQKFITLSSPKTPQTENIQHFGVTYFVIQMLNLNN
jgi:hypothetical protein